MTDYRAFLLNADGRIFKVVEVQAASGEAACQEVERLQTAPHGFELWTGRTLVAKIDPGPAAES